MFKQYAIALLCLFAGAATYAQSATSNDPVYEQVLRQMDVENNKTLQNGKGELDSAKVYAFLAVNDPLYDQRVPYRVLRLDLIQQTHTRSEDNYFVYDSLLAATPNYLLFQSPSHGFNKLQTGSAVPLDTAYALCKYLASSQPGIFYHWLQQAFSQAFHDAPDLPALQADWRRSGLSERRIRQLLAYANNEPYARALLAKLVQDTATTNYVYPLALLLQLQDQPADTAIQAHVLQGFSRLDYAAFRQGNAGRYAMQAYSLLTPQVPAARKDSLLHHTMQLLQQASGDSTNYDHFAAQNLLAYAYKRQYLDSRDRKSEQAMQYLAKAAYYSPHNAQEESNLSFYDQVAIGSEAKKSYRADFAQALIAQGNNKLALKIMARQLIADPATASELKETFVQQFPDGNFRGFLQKEVIGTLPMAPDFRLRTPDGALHQLSDYRGKWLLLDFWGIWCGPCRRELPAINAYAASIRNDSSRAFLSIDCGDEAATLQAFLKGNNYSFPVTLSDRKVEQQYAIHSYPAKLLITPDGHMLVLDFHTPWEQVMAQFPAIAGTQPNAKGTELRKKKD